MKSIFKTLVFQALDLFFQRAWKVSYESVILFFKHSQIGETPDLLFKSCCNRTLIRSKLTSKKTPTKPTLKSRVS